MYLISNFIHKYHSRYNNKTYKLDPVFSWSSVTIVVFAGLAIVPVWSLEPMATVPWLPSVIVPVKLVIIWTEAIAKITWPLVTAVSAVIRISSIVLVVVWITGTAKASTSSACGRLRLTNTDIYRRIRIISSLVTIVSSLVAIVSFVVSLVSLVIVVSLMPT